MKVLGFLALVIAALFFAHGLIAASLPHVYAAVVSERFGLDADALGLLILILPAVYIPMQFVAGLLLDRFGARSTLLAAAALAALGLVLSIILTIPALGAAGRALHAVGMAFAFVGALYIASRCFVKRHFATYAGLVQAIGFASLAAWYLSSDAALGASDMPMLYYGGAVAAIVLAVLFALFVSVGPVLEGRARPAPTPFVLGAVGALLIRPRLWLIILASAAAGVPLGLYGQVWVTQAPIVANAPQGADAFEIAAVFAASFAFGGLFAGVLSDAHNRRRGTAIAFQLLAAGAFAVLAGIPDLPPLRLGAVMVAAGFFSGSSILFYALAHDRSPPQHAGFFLALVHAAFVCGAAGSAYAASLFAPLTDVVALAPYLAPLSAVLAAAIVVLVPDTGPVDIAPPEAPAEPEPAPPAAEPAEEETAAVAEPEPETGAEPAASVEPVAAAEVIEAAVDTAPAAEASETAALAEAETPVEPEPAQEGAEPAVETEPAASEAEPGPTGGEPERAEAADVADEPALESVDEPPAGAHGEGVQAEPETADAEPEPASDDAPPSTDDTVPEVQSEDGAMDEARPEPAADTYASEDPKPEKAKPKQTGEADKAPEPSKV